MKSSKPHIRELKSTDISIADLARIKLPRLQKPQKKSKKPPSKLYSRFDSTPRKPEKIPNDNIDSPTSLTKHFQNKAKAEILRKMRTSLSCNRDPSTNSHTIPTKELPRSTSISDSDESSHPVSKPVCKYSKRIFFNRRLEMGNKNLVVVNFEGVLGEFFKENLWENKEESFYLREKVPKGMRLLAKEFQIALFFNSPESDTERVLEYFESKDVRIDAAYVSENANQWKNKSTMLKKSLKYSQHIQNYSQLTIDFSMQHEVLCKMLIITSVCLEGFSYWLSGPELIVKNPHTLPIYLCRGVPILDNPDCLLPITFAVSDPRLDNSGCDFLEIAETISHMSKFSSDFEQCSWIDGFAQYRETPQRSCIAFESSLYQLGLAQQKLKISKAQINSTKIEKIERCMCPNDMKSLCRSGQYGNCTCYKKLKSYFLSGNEIPGGWVKNKFIVHRNLTGLPYKLIS